jgi:hypothetical protein
MFIRIVNFEDQISVRGWDVITEKITCLMIIFFNLSLGFLTKDLLYIYIYIYIYISGGELNSRIQNQSMSID